MKAIKKILMERDGMSAKDAEELIRDAKTALRYYLEDGDIDEAHNICYEYFNLEPDYIDQLGYNL